MTHKHETTFVIGGAEVGLKVEFGYVRAEPQMPPSFMSGGEPAVPAEIDVTLLEWSPPPAGDAPKEAVWHAIERGPLFDLIAMDLYEELLDAVINEERPE